jgi:AcrR family transcriptional regulator
MYSMTTLEDLFTPASIQCQHVAPGMSDDHGYHHGDLRTALVGIARELVRESGPEGWSMREACRRAGVSQAAPYRHFADKPALLDAVGADAYGDLERRYRDAIRASANPAEEAVVVARAYLRFALEEPRLFRLIFSNPRLHGTPEANASYHVFERAIRSAQDHGALPAGSTTMLAHVFWSAVHGVADLVLSGSFGRRHGKDVAERMLDALLRGLHAA